MKYDLKKPCENCPFRNDRPGFLNKARAREIVESITDQDGTFSCHKHNKFADDDSEDAIETKDSQHCAGALIFLEKLGRPNQMMRICERLKMYDRHKLQMDSPVYNSPREFIKAQPK